MHRKKRGGEKKETIQGGDHWGAGGGRVRKGRGGEVMGLRKWIWGHGGWKNFLGRAGHLLIARKGTSFERERKKVAQLAIGQGKKLVVAAGSGNSGEGITGIQGKMPELSETSTAKFGGLPSQGGGKESLQSCWG